MPVNVRSSGYVVGSIEQTNGGNWFAEFNGTEGTVPLGAFRSRDLARAAVLAHLNGFPIVGRIPVQINLGPRAGGQA